MVGIVSIIVVGILSVCSALPTQDPVIRKLDPGHRFQYIQGPDGTPHLVDLWLKASDLVEAARFDPDAQNVYHLFTRSNPSVSQPMLLGNDGLIGLTNYNANRRTVVLLHGWMDGATGSMNSVLVPAFLDAEDLNVIVVDWSRGANTVNYIAAVTNTVTSGESVARFLNWLNRATGASAMLYYHIVGHSLGAHQAGVIGRNVESTVAYITGLDPAFPGWLSNDHKFREDDGGYTEIIHTNAGLLGYLGTLGHVDFYPNGGVNMPGCDSQQCDHDRLWRYELSPSPQHLKMPR